VISEKLFIITRLLSVAMSQSVVLLLVYYLSASEFGALAILLSVSQLVISFLVDWHSGTVLNHGQKYYSRSKSLYTILVFRGSLFLVSTAFLLGLTLIGAGSWVNQFTGFDNGFYLLFLFVLAESSFEYFQNILVVYGKLLLNSIAILIIKGSCFFYVLWSFTDLESYFEFSFALHISYAIFVLICLIIIDKPAASKVEYEKFRELYIFSFWAVFNSVSVLAANHAYNYILIWSDMALSDIGAHSLAFRALMSLSILVYFVRVFYAKSLYSKSSPEKITFLRIVLQRYLKYYLLFASLGYFLVGILVYVLAIVLSGDSDYQNSLFYMLLYYPAFVLFQRAQFLGIMLNNSESFRRENLAFMYMTFCGLLFNILFVVFFGIYGIIAGTTLGYLVFNLLISKYINLPFYLTLRRAH